MRQNIPFNNSYSKLPERFFSHVSPTPVNAPKLIKLNVPLTQELGLCESWLTSDEGVAMLAGNFIPQGAQPLAAVYAGHQFGYFSPQLGDGRAVLLGEIIGKNGRLDVQLKGAGPTPYSRQGDGRAALGPVLREYIMSEAMFALGVPTTRALACVTTGEGVIRNEILPGAIITRIAASHIRIGTFQYFAACSDQDAVKILADYVIKRHYPDAANAPNPYAALLISVVEKQAELVAKWQNIGFIHGVMNTDNMSVSGETIDYGPCAFMDVYDPETVFSSIDSNGRYAYSNQPKVAQWNLARFAETLMPLLARSEAEALSIAQSAIDSFNTLFENAFFNGMRSKLGLFTTDQDDEALIKDLLALLQHKKLDYTVFFYKISDFNVYFDDEDLNTWVRRLTERAARESQSQSRHRQGLHKEGLHSQSSQNIAERFSLMKRSNPAYIPRNHLVEEAIKAAVRHNNYTPFQNLTNVLSNPYQRQEGYEKYALPPETSTEKYYTFCGT